MRFLSTENCGSLLSANEAYKHTSLVPDRAQIDDTFVSPIAHASTHVLVSNVHGTCLGIM